jgi:hypothetical protein
MACKSGCGFDFEFDSSFGSNFFDIVRFLAHKTDLEDPLDYDTNSNDWIGFRGPAETLSWLLQQSNSTYRDRDLKSCVLFALKLCAVAVQPDMAALVRTILEGRRIDATLCKIKDNNGNTLLHCAAWNLGEYYARNHSLKYPSSGPIGVDGKKVDDVGFDGPKLLDLLTLIRQLVDAGSDLHTRSNIEGTRNTPLLQVLSGYTFSLFLQDFETGTALRDIIPVTVWLIQLQRSGIDLAAYGEMEQRTQRKRMTNKEFEQYEWERECVGGRRIGRLRLIHFSFGPHPSDWEFWFVPVMDQSFVEFWDMTEHPERAIPGSWNETVEEGKEDGNESEDWYDDGGSAED